MEWSAAFRFVERSAAFRFVEWSAAFRAAALRAADVLEPTAKEGAARRAAVMTLLVNRHIANVLAHGAPAPSRLCDTHRHHPADEIRDGRRAVSRGLFYNKTPSYDTEHLSTG